MEEQMEDPRIKIFSEKMKDKNNRILAEYAMGFEKPSSFFGRHHPINIGYMTYNKDEDEFTETYDTYIHNNDNKSLEFVNNILNPEYKKSTDYFLGAYISVGFLIVYIILLFIIIPMLNIPNNSVLVIPLIITILLTIGYLLGKIVVSAYPFYAWKKTRSNNNKTE